MPHPTKYLIDHFKGLIERTRAVEAVGQVQDKAPLMIAWAEAILVGTFVTSLIALVIKHDPAIPFAALLGFKIGEGWGRFSKGEESKQP